MMPRRGCFVVHPAPGRGSVFCDSDFFQRPLLFLDGE